MVRSEPLAGPRAARRACRARRRWLGLAVCAALGAALGGDLAAAARAAEPAAVVTLTIDYGDGVEKRFTQLPWTEGMTVRDALAAAQAHPRGIRCQTRGAGATLFLLAIDDVANEGGGGRNWVYQVNDKLADRSLALYRLAAGDAVLWKFDRSR